MKNQNEIKISVRNLIEFVLRSGNLDSRFKGSSRAIAGTRAHQKIQKESAVNYKPEVHLIFTTEYKDLLFTIEGRADGIIVDDEKTTIDEIKSITIPLELIHEEYNALHWAQAMCYGYFYSKQNDLINIDIQLTYFHIETEEIKHFVRTLSLDELQTFFLGILDKYIIWAQYTKEWVSRRNRSIKKLDFPFDNYRPGQRKFAVSTYKIIKENKKLFVQAPTGTGKTVSTLFPAIKAIGEGHTSKVFYLTAKTITRQVAEETIGLMEKGGLELKSITLTAKEKICFKEEKICNPEYCEFANGHFDRVNEAILDVLYNENKLSRDVIEEYSKRHQVCPFEYSLDLAIWCDTIICDYNYAFDPKVYLRRFFEDSNDFIFLVDEAHNLVDRGREMFSASIYKRPFLELKMLMKDKEPKISKTLNKLNSFILKIGKNCIDEKHFLTEEEPLEIYPLLRKFINESEEWLSKNEKTEGHQELLQLYFDCQSFLRIAELYNENYVTYIEKNSKDTRLKIYCIDPSHLLKECFTRAKATILFSATLLPLPYYREILGGDEQDYMFQIQSPFNKENLGLYILSNISTKYKDREQSYMSVVDYIYAVVKPQRGNYMVFLPSYDYMNKIHDLFNDRHPDIKTSIQLPSMTEEERENFLEQLVPNPRDFFLVFAVMGGIFSEGIDLKGNRLTGAIIIGVGLPQICLERDIIKDYFNEKNGCGYEYAYIYPGMNKVLQAAGRVIRTETDLGVVALVDSRFAHKRYKNLFPLEWSHYIESDHLTETQDMLIDFWSQQISSDS